ncbi:MAG: bifunctional methylenetetrahydrofolate dehydrogenase/methenyltetrahydrofolate cyclohydrolase [Candidatus Magasanikbacteria bacterium CG10_big_fil_rev_8_21_14_0_10_47_10]|uniref:Bifunctional protein FolD n=1 Tax=Candidatus Magasanikbacteria bacterium CG10_big_fil_rev_8_21_14_0_10_47_10 TaxID=1974652 RepID=A0A2H0TPQ3_9BACT|nr:MAG: bifunctional methylenetetrahydrofolate dehydrogenase/methenyltetrahydrofolate cyclohydrolase [Candidatus Magasanikbacteria bacterium CG10_big_fil_rev_8_21_14_0_10_47_10]
MTKLIDGKRIASLILAKTKAAVEQLALAGEVPKLAVVLVGEDKPSQTYVGRKGKAAEKVGMAFSLHTLPSTTTTEELLARLTAIQSDALLSGLIVQLPLPKHIDTGTVINMIRPEVDVDCLTDVNLGKIVMQTNHMVPPTPGAVMSVLHHLNVDLVGKRVTIVGTGPLVGKPLAIMMMNESASVRTCNSKTPDTKERCLDADIIVTGVGKKHLIRGDMVSPGAIVIDTGVDFDAGKMYGDVHVEEVERVAGAVTPTPGGIGPITVARLLWNTVLCEERKRFREKKQIIQ